MIELYVTLWASLVRDPLALLFALYRSPAFLLYEIAIEVFLSVTQVSWGANQALLFLRTS
jgi:hypothetical protein